MKTKTYLAATVVGLSLLGGCASGGMFTNDTSVRDNNVGFQLAKKGQYAAAEPYFRKALDANPNNPYALNNLAFLYEMQGRTSDATALYQRVLATPGTFIPTEEVLGNDRGTVVGNDEFGDTYAGPESVKDIAQKHVSALTKVAPTSIPVAK